MTTKSTVHFPPPALASCLAMAIARDTRQARLCDADRMNYFPASPLVAFTVVLHGQLRVSLDLCDLTTIRNKSVMPQVTVTPPQTKPTLSWSDGPIHAITVGFYPDAWASLGGDVATARLPDPLAKAAEAVLDAPDMTQAWAQFCNVLNPIWTAARQSDPSPHWAGSHRVADWTRHLLTRAALTGAGQSARSFERRMKRWTGQSKRALSAFAQLEDLHSLHINEPGAALAEIATGAQYSDQSHMGRAVKRTTGFSPARLNQLIDANEAFWCYRLLGERL